MHSEQQTWLVLNRAAYWEHALPPIADALDRSLDLVLGEVLGNVYGAVLDRALGEALSD
jgi:hypothetical protein